MGLEGKDLMQREAVGDEILLEKALSGSYHLALEDAELLCDRGVGPEGAAFSVGGQVEEEKERDLLQGEPVENVPESMVHPGEVRGKGSDPGGIDGLSVGKRCAHGPGVYSGAENRGAEAHEEVGTEEPLRLVLGEPLQGGEPPKEPAAPSAEGLATALGAEDEELSCRTEDRAVAVVAAVGEGASPAN